MTDFNNIRASINPAHVKKLLPFMASHDIRYYLNGLCIEKAKAGGVYIIATDGHTMCIVHDANGTIDGAESVIFRVTAGLANAAKTASRKKVKGLDYRLLVQGQRVKVACGFESEGDAEYFVQAGRSLIEGKFPNWRKVVPEFDKLKPGCLSSGNGMNALYLARLAKIVDSSRYSGVTLWQEHPDKAIVARLQLIPEMVIVMMPMRDGTPDPSMAFKGFPLDRELPIEEPVLEPA